MSLGRGMAMSYSWKQKINMKSSTEAEIVGVDDFLAYILWAIYFLQEQGYDLEPSLVYQENLSAILLEMNGKASSSKRTKHIKVKYFSRKGQDQTGQDRRGALPHRPKVDQHQHQAQTGGCDLPISRPGDGDPTHVQ